MKPLNTQNPHLTGLWQSVIACCTLTAATVSLPTAAQAQQLSLPGIPDGQSFFSQDVTDTVTQGFRFRDHTFFDEGNQQFEHIIEDSQHPEATGEPLLRVEPTPEAWQQPSPHSAIEPVE